MTGAHYGNKKWMSAQDTVLLRWLAIGELVLYSVYATVCGSKLRENQVVSTNEFIHSVVYCVKYD